MSMLPLLNSPATRPVSTRVLTGRVAGLSSKNITVEWPFAVMFSFGVTLIQIFTMSISQVFIKGRNSYEVDDEVVVYFCFPTLGVAVPLRPGDFLMFNALIPHCISS
jgi:hypothetical protein